MVSPLAGSPARAGISRGNSGLRRSKTINPEETKAHLDVLKKRREDEAEGKNKLTEQSF
jgi:hypothetical protein